MHVIPRLLKASFRNNGRIAAGARLRNGCQRLYFLSTRNSAVPVSDVGRFQMPAGKIRPEFAIDVQKTEDIPNDRGKAILIEINSDVLAERNKSRYASICRQYIPNSKNG